MQMGKVAEAIEDADEAVKYDPTYVKAHWRRGQASGACGNAAAALASFEKALELEPTNKALQKEVTAAKERKEKEDELLAAAEKAAAEGDGEGDAEMSEAPKVTAVPKPTTAAEEKPKQSTADAVKDTDGSLFTKSDHVRGYKIRSDGKKTSYFDREISEEAKKMIGDIAPKKLGDVGANDNAPKPIAAAEGTSVWNKAGECISCVRADGVLQNQWDRLQCIEDLGCCNSNAHSFQLQARGRNAT